MVYTKITWQDRCPRPPVMGQFGDLPCTAEAHRAYTCWTQRVKVAIKDPGASSLSGVFDFSSSVCFFSPVLCYLHNNKFVIKLANAVYTVRQES